MCERFTRTGQQRYNIARDGRATVRLLDGERALRWGLLPPWRGHGGKREPTVYTTTLDRIAATPFQRRAARCLVLADGFYAWRKLGKRKQPYWIHAAERAFAGIATTNHDDGIESFALLVTEASARIAHVTATMPIVVDERWLAGELAPLEVAWRADAVSNHVDDPAHDDARCIATLGNPAQGELF